MRFSRLLLCGVLAASACSPAILDLASAAPASSLRTLHGTVTWREPIAMLPNARLHLVLLAQVPGEADLPIVAAVLPTAGVNAPFTVKVPSNNLFAGTKYWVRAWIVVGGKVLMRDTKASTPVNDWKNPLSITVGLISPNAVKQTGASNSSKPVLGPEITMVPDEFVEATPVPTPAPTPVAIPYPTLAPTPKSIPPQQPKATPKPKPTLRPKPNKTGKLPPKIAPKPNATPKPIPTAVTKNTFVLHGKVLKFDMRALSMTARVIVELRDVSKGDGVPTLIGQNEINLDGKQLPVEYKIALEGVKLNPKGRYSVSARVMEGDQTPYHTDANYPVDPTAKDQWVNVRIVPIQ